MNASRSILLLSAACCALASAQVYTTPVGYNTTTLNPGFNLIGLSLHGTPLYQGTFESNTTTSLTDDQGAFSVTASSTYILEMGSTTGVPGVIIELPGTAFTSTTISGLTGITSSYLGSYIIRQAPTLSNIFGASSTCILKKGSSTTADLVYIPNASGGFDVYYHTTDVTVPVPIPGKWQLVGGGSTDRASTPICYLDGFYVQIRGSAVDLTVTGEVKLQNTSLPVANGFNYFSAVYPAGSTLATSSLASSVLKGSSTTADLVYMPNASGGFDVYYHSADVTIPVPIPGKWQLVGGGSTDRATTPLTSAFIIQRRGASANMTYTVPVSYNP